MRSTSALEALERRADPKNVEGMARFGIRSARILGVPKPALRALAKEIGEDHNLAGELWAAGIHEARILAALVEDPRLVTPEQMDEWVACFDNWDLCDQVCCHLFDKTPWAWEKAEEWSRREEEFVRRAAFVTVAALAVHDRKAADERFTRLLPLIEERATDGRNFVKKAVNWALRQIGKRNANLRQAAIGTARKIERNHSSAARWVARDALRELTNRA